MGWASKRNGELLALAAAEFDVFLTADRNLSYQQTSRLRYCGNRPSCEEQHHRRPAPARTYDSGSSNQRGTRSGDARRRLNPARAIRYRNYVAIRGGAGQVGTPRIAL